MTPLMTGSGHDARVSESHVSILDRPVYGLGEAAGLLGLRSDRTRAWLDGYRHGSADRRTQRNEGLLAHERVRSTSRATAAS